MILRILAGLVALVGLVVTRVYTLLPGGHRSTSRPRPAKPSSSTSSLGVFLGSGGHTAEMAALLSTLDYGRYTPRKYVLCHGDDMSLRAVARVESASGTSSKEDYGILLLPRARKVGQSWASTVLSTAYTLVFAVYHTFLVPLLANPNKPWVDVLIVNGPGTCVVLVAVAWLRRILRLSHSRIIYVESFARVNSLSLSGKILRPIVDSFVIQWPNAAGSTPSRGPLRGNVEYKGWVV